MTFDHTKAFETSNGIILDDVTGVGIFSGIGSPVGTDAPFASYYFNKTDGLMWFKFGAGVNDWRTVNPEYFQDHNTIFTSTGSGVNFNKKFFERLCLGHMNSLDQEPNNSTNLWQIICEQSGNSSVDVQLYDVTNAQVLAGPINFTETTPTYKEVTFTPPPGPEPVIEIQGMKNGNSNGEIFWSAIEVRRLTL